MDPLKICLECRQSGEEVGLVFTRVLICRPCGRIQCRPQDAEKAKEEMQALAGGTFLVRRAA